jgi:hypothetical protein
MIYHHASVHSRKDTLHVPLIQITRRQTIISDNIINALTDALTELAASELSCEDGGILSPEDIMFEVNSFGHLDRNCKDIHIRVIAHDYPSRRGEDLERLDAIRRSLSNLVVNFIPTDATWNVWVLLSITSYGSDSEP